MPCHFSKGEKRDIRIVSKLESHKNLRMAVSRLDLFQIFDKGVSQLKQTHKQKSKVK